MRVLGKVLQAETEEPLTGLLVRAYDKDLIRDDHLGDTHTDSAGRFEIVYTEAQFRDLNETLPDVYLRVFDPSGKRLLYSTEKAVRRNALTTEQFEIRIPQAQLEDS